MSKYNWSNGPAELEPHSLAKHKILRDYIERYVLILMRGGSVPNLRLALIDGFAGGGEYVVKGRGGELYDGSPHILINAVRAAEAQINAKRDNPVSVDADFFFIEKDRTVFDYLESTLKRRYDERFLKEKVKCRHGAFEDYIDAIIRDLNSTRGRKPRPIFVLDQYGYSNVPIKMLARIMGEFDRAEVFLTLAVDHISAYSNSLGGALEQLHSSMHIDPSKVKAFVCGNRKMEELDRIDENDRDKIMLHIQYLLHETFAKHAGAKCYTPFFITSTKSHKSYWFLHLANHARANDVVKDLHWRVTNSFKHYGRAGTRMLMLGHDPLRPSRDQLSFNFDDSARQRTLDALIEELPALLHEKYRNGVTLENLYDDICNETPASKEILGEGLNVLCSIGEFEKVGAEDQDRRAETRFNDSDTIHPAKELLLFSISDLRTPTHLRKKQ